MKALREHLGLEAGASWSAGKRGPKLVKEQKGETAEGPATFELSAAAPQGERELAIRHEAPEN